MTTLTIKLCFDPKNDIFFADVAGTRLTSRDSVQELARGIKELIGDLADVKFSLDENAFDLLEDLGQLDIRLS